MRQDVSRGHKLAVRDLEAGAPVHRYGQVIGFTRGPVAAGEHVHLHNLEYREFERAYEFAVDGVRARAGLGRGGPGHVRRYVRADGSVGTRNFLGIMTTVNCSATAARQIANRMRYSGILDDFENVDGVVALTHGLGCGMDPNGEGIEVLRRVMRGYLTHPNFAGFLILGLGCEDNQVKALTNGVELRSTCRCLRGPSRRSAARRRPWPRGWSGSPACSRWPTRPGGWRCRPAGSCSGPTAAAPTLTPG